MRECKRCLLREAGEGNIYKTVNDFISNLDEDEKVSSDEYSGRLNLCKTCNNLISGMCLKCGCYVEIRAILKNKDCPNYDNKKW